MSTRKEDTKNEKIKQINRVIADLVYDKTAIKKAYNYYHGKMDLDQYKHLEENYGIGTPTQIKFIPLIKKHIDALIGYFLDLPLNVQISCKDEDTVSKIFREKYLRTLEAIKKEYINNFQAIISSITDNQQKVDPITVERINNIKESINKNFISEFEIAAQRLIKYFSQSRNIDLNLKKRLLYTDLLVSGTVYYKEYPTPNGENIELEILDPINTFVEKNPNSYYLKDCRRAVCRYYMTADQILNKYNLELEEEDKQKLRDGLVKYGQLDNQTYIIRSSGPVNAVTNDNTENGTGILGGLEASPTWDGNYSMYSARRREIVVYEVEYIEVDKQGIEHRYSGVKIGEDIFIDRPDDLNVVRSRDNEKKCTLSVNGLFMCTRNNQPFSLVLATMNLQDQYNLLFFFKENLLALSGVKGGYVDFSKIPLWLDEDETNRLLKFIAYKKQGFAPLDFSQSEPGAPPVNTIYNGYDDTVPLTAIQAIDLSIERVEQAASSITGVFKEMIGGIEQKDAVHNVKVGIEQSFIVTKPYFANMNLLLKEILLDSLNLAKIVYKNGLTGTIILGEKNQQLFKVLPEYYTLTDFDIHIIDGQETVRDLQDVKAMNLELIKAGQVDAEIAISTVGCKSITEFKNKSLEAIRKRKEETSQLTQMQQMIQQYESQMKQLQQALQQSQQQVQQLQNQLVEKENNDEKNKIDWFKAQSEDKFKKDKIEVEKDKVKLELTQMFDNNPNNNEVKY